jgi:hypothetical protein
VDAVTQAHEGAEVLATAIGAFREGARSSDEDGDRRLRGREGTGEGEGGERRERLFPAGL